MGGSLDVTGYMCNFCYNVKEDGKTRIICQDCYKQKDATKKDLINPDHYKRGGLEAIDVIRSFELDYLTGNAVKYLLRAGHKDDTITDYKKAIWYLERKVKELNNA